MCNPMHNISFFPSLLLFNGSILNSKTAQAWMPKDSLIFPEVTFFW